MSNGGNEQAPRNPLRRVIPVFLVVIIAISSSAGCIDKGIADSLVEIVEGDDGPGYVWGYLLEPQEGTFVIQPEDDTELDIASIAEKVFDNITSLDPGQTITNFKAILNEENLSMVTFPFSFYVIEGTRTLNIELTGIFKTTVGDSAWSGGWMELTIKKPEGGSDMEEINQLGEKQVHTFPQDPIPGIWELELQGTGMQSPGNLIYSGEFILSVRGEIPRNS